MSSLRDIKRRFFAMRNGMMGEQLRRNGADYRIIFGLNLPQIVEIACDFPADAELARALWANVSTRESMLLAPMLFPPELMDREEAMRWITSAQSIETVDVLCHRLLRQLPFAAELPAELLADGIAEPLVRYAGIRLMFNLLNEETAPTFEPLARAEAASALPTAPVAQMLVSQIEWLTEEDEDEEEV